MEKKNINPKNLEKNFTSLQDLFGYLLGEQVFVVEKENESSKNLNQAEKCSYNQVKTTANNKVEYVPQIGDEVIITDEQFKGIKGKIIAEVDGYDKYQIKIDEFNALYIPKDKVEIIKKKSDAEKEEKIKKIKQAIHNTKCEKDKLENKLNSMECKLDNLYKQLEQYGIHNEFCEFLDNEI